MEGRNVSVKGFRRHIGFTKYGLQYGEMRLSLSDLVGVNVSLESSFVSKGAPIKVCERMADV